MPASLADACEPACDARTSLALAGLPSDAALHARASYRTALARRAIGYALRRSHPGGHRDASAHLVHGSRHRSRHAPHRRTRRRRRRAHCSSNRPPRWAGSTACGRSTTSCSPASACIKASSAAATCRPIRARRTSIKSRPMRSARSTLRAKRALVQERRASLFPFAAAANPNRSQQVQTGVAMLDHPLTALLAALDSADEAWRRHDRGRQARRRVLGRRGTAAANCDRPRDAAARVGPLDQRERHARRRDEHRVLHGLSAVRRRAAPDRHHDGDRLAQHHDVRVPGRFVSV